jgi:uncharacterized membrane protein YoaK (UPF0700 family)
MQTNSSTVSPVVLSARESLAPRHFTSWLTFALAAGATNAGAFLACQRFVTHVTGTVTRIGLDGGDWTLMAEYGLVLLLFVFGAFLSVFAVQRRAARGKPPLAWVALAAVVGLLLAVSVAGQLDVFGPFAGSVEQPTDFLLLSVLALAMGLQNATVASSTAVAVRTTHMTGPATDVGVHLGVALYSSGEGRREALRLALLRGGKIAAFIFGALAMTILVGRVGYASFVFPAVLVALGTARSFAPRFSFNQLPQRAIS